MSWSELHHTLTALVEAIEPPPGSGLIVDGAELTVPLEATTATGPDGLVVWARVPHTRWTAGFLPPVHLGRLTIEGVADVR